MNCLPLLKPSQTRDQIQVRCHCLTVWCPKLCQWWRSFQTEWNLGSLIEDIVRDLRKFNKRSKALDQTCPKPRPIVSKSKHQFITLMAVGVISDLLICWIDETNARISVSRKSTHIKQFPNKNIKHAKVPRMNLPKFEVMLTPRTRDCWSESREEELITDTLWLEPLPPTVNCDSWNPAAVCKKKWRKSVNTA